MCILCAAIDGDTLSFESIGPSYRPASAKQPARARCIPELNGRPQDFLSFSMLTIPLADTRISFPGTVRGLSWPAILNISPPKCVYPSEEEEEQQSDGGKLFRAPTIVAKKKKKKKSNSGRVPVQQCGSHAARVILLLMHPSDHKWHSIIERMKRLFPPSTP